MRLQFPWITAAVLTALSVGAVTIHWNVNRVYVEPGQSLLLRYKGPLLFGDRGTPEPGTFADLERGEIGVLEELRGPGRHFYCPIWWDRTIIDDVVVKPGEIAIVTSKMGTNLDAGQFLVDGELGEVRHRGVLRKVYGPGRYRANPYAYEFKLVTLEREDRDGQVKQSGWVEIPTGYVGVLTNLTDNPLTGEAKGIAQDVLPPGIYMVNPRGAKVDVIEIGFREKTVEVLARVDARGEVLYDKSGEPIIADAASGISFPSNDGFPINMDFTAIWGIMPDQASHAVQTFGNIEAVETKVVVPQIESICRNVGSRKGAVELLVGEGRQQFQADTLAAFHSVLDDKSVTLLYSLVRHIYIPSEVRVPIQNANIANELKETRDQEQVTAQVEAELREAEQRVELEAARIHAETERKVAARLADGRRQAEETRAETVKLIAAIDRQTAELEAEATVVLGEAGATARKLNEEAQAQRFGLAVDAFGGGPAFNQWVFATGLPEQIELELLYAGDGTFWTDLQQFNSTLLARQAAQDSQ